MKKLLIVTFLSFSFAYATENTELKELKKNHKHAIDQLKQRISQERLFAKPHHNKIAGGLPYALGFSSARRVLDFGAVLPTRGFGNVPDLTAEYTMLIGIIGATLFGFASDTVETAYNKNVRDVVKNQEEAKLATQLKALDEIIITILSAEQEAHRVLLQELITSNDTVQKQSAALKVYKGSLTGPQGTIIIPEDQHGMLDTCLQASRATKKTLEGALKALQKQ